MSSARATLTPQMEHYTERLYDDGRLRWLPYVLYFHPYGHRSHVANTDRAGFRLSRAGDRCASAAGTVPAGPVNVLAGSSAAFGVGASTDAATVASRLWAEHAPARPWLNFGGRSHNSAQELVLFTLHRHLLPEVREIVLLSGFNNLGLARLPDAVQGEHGAFYQVGEFEEKLNGPPGGRRRRRSGGDGGGPAAEGSTAPIPPAAHQVATAAERTLRHLAGWQLLAGALGARLSFVLQPLASWVRDVPAEPECRLFAELDELFSFSEMYGDITPPAVGRDYSAALRAGCARLGVPYLDLSPLLAAAAGPRDWLFVDRAHLTDAGYDLAARLLAGHLGLS